MSTYNMNILSMPESLNHEDYVIGTYLIKAITDDFLKYAAHLAVEESTGSWIPLPLETPALLERHGAKLIKAFQVPDHEFATAEKELTFIAEIAFPYINFGYQLPMLLNTMIGVISFFGNIKLAEFTNNGDGVAINRYVRTCQLFDDYPRFSVFPNYSSFNPLNVR